LICLNTDPCLFFQKVLKFSRRDVYISIKGGSLLATMMDELPFERYYDGYLKYWILSISLLAVIGITTLNIIIFRSFQGFTNKEGNLQ